MTGRSHLVDVQRASPQSPLETSAPSLDATLCGDSEVEERDAALSLIDRYLLILLMVIGAALRLDFMRAVGFTIDSDEAIVGLMAKHILEGEPVPTFYYGQHYMGSLEAIMASASFALFGTTGFALQLVPLVWSLALIVVMFFLGKELGGRTVGRIAALLTAIPPVALVVWSTKARGGFIEILVLGALAMYGATRWFKSSARVTTYPILIGLVLGIGWWVNNQILYFMLPIALFSAFYLLQEWIAARCSLLEAARVVGVGSAAFLVGGSCYWLYNVEHDFPSLGMFGRSNLEEIGEHLQGLWSTAVPILLGAKHFWEADEIFPGATSLYYGVYGALLVVVAFVRRREILQLFRGQLDRREPVEMLLLFLLAAFSIFVVSTFGWLYRAPRYLLPSYVGVFIVAGYACAVLLRRWRAFGIVALVALITLNICSSYAGGRAVPGEPVVFDGDRVSRDHTEVIAALERLGITKIKTNYWIGYRLAFETKERVTFVVSGEPRQVRIERYESGISDGDRDRLPLLLVRAEADRVRPALTRLGYDYRELDVSGYKLFYDLTSSVRQLTRISIDAIAEVRAMGPQQPWGAVDDSSHTRWGSGRPQAHGMSFEVLFKTPHVLRAIEYDLGDWVHDYPRGLEIQLVLQDGSRETVLTEEEYRGIQLFLRDRISAPIVFPAREVTGVVLKQTGKHPIVDWSIAELHFFTEQG